MTKKQILVIEDESLIIMMLEDILDELGHEMAADTGSVADALAILDDDAVTARIDAAIVDVNLGAEKVWPVADRLIALQIPFMLSTGSSASDCPPAYQHIPNIRKPYSFNGLQSALEALFAADAPR